jgi:hypothetical protein
MHWRLRFVMVGVVLDNKESLTKQLSSESKYDRIN